MGIIKGFEDMKEEKQPNYKASANAPKTPWHNEVVSKMRGEPRAPQMSPLTQWYFTEKHKRSAGLENEIDINEIIAASKGVKNKWSARLKQHPEKFKGILDGTKNYDWQEIIAL